MIKAKRKKSRGSGIDVLYKVDPKKLSIKLCYTSMAIEPVAQYATNFECFSFERIEVEPDIPARIGKLPAIIDGIFYCATEEEAQDFIKKQIGL